MPKEMFYLEDFIIMCSINVKNTLFRTFCTPMYTCHLWWNYKAQSFQKLKVAFNNAFRMMHNLPTYGSASEMFTVNSRAGTNTPSDEYDTYRDTGWRIRIYIREYSNSLYSLVHSTNRMRGRVKKK